MKLKFPKLGWFMEVCVALAIGALIFITIVSIFSF